MTPTLTLAELGSARAPRAPARPEAARPHLWRGDRCDRCAMLRSWPGGRVACEGGVYSAHVMAPQCVVWCGNRRRRRCGQRAMAGAEVCGTHARMARVAETGQDGRAFP